MLDLLIRNGKILDTHGVLRGSIGISFAAIDNNVPLPTVVRAMSAAPAMLFGLAPRKGSVLPGADADLMLFDASARRPVDVAKAWPSVCPNPLADTAFAGWPQMTISRGTIVWQDGQVMVALGHGTLIEQHANGSA
jgi:dihydropyrimidinase